MGEYAIGVAGLFIIKLKLSVERVALGGFDVTNVVSPGANTFSPPNALIPFGP